ncbi:MAG: hypothetical protein PHT34_06270 [Oscillospiraceae bacterium]|nr:hypothetical protein [Oscillospiraceae bacterium]
MNLDDFSFSARKLLYPLIWEAHSSGIPTPEIVYGITTTADRLSRSFDTAAILEAEEEKQTAEPNLDNEE